MHEISDPKIQQFQNVEQKSYFLVVVRIWICFSIINNFSLGTISFFKYFVMVKSKQRLNDSTYTEYDR